MDNKDSEWGSWVRRMEQSQYYCPYPYPYERRSQPRPKADPAEPAIPVGKDGKPIVDPDWWKNLK